MQELTQPNLVLSHLDYNMKILVACEFSQIVTKAFREKGHEAYSCDIEPTEGNPDWHIQDDCLNIIPSQIWDIIIFHPDCTKMAVSGNRWYGKGTVGFWDRCKAIEWTVDAWNLILKYSKSSCLENPVSVIFKHIDYDILQYIQPWMFGHGETKKTGLALKNLPELNPTIIVKGREQRIWKMPPSPERKKERSRTFLGIAQAIAYQWG